MQSPTHNVGEQNHTATQVVREWIPRVIRENLTPGKVFGSLLAVSVAINTYVIGAQYEIRQLKSDVSSIKSSVAEMKTNTNASLDKMQKQLDILPPMNTQMALTAVKVTEINDWKTKIDDIANGRRRR